MLVATVKHRVMVIFLGVIFLFILLEIGLRVIGFAFIRIQDFRNRNEALAGEKYRIMCVGESTTALGGRDSYPSQLEEILNNRGENRRFEVINKGIPGTDSSVILEQFESNLDQYDPDVVVAMTGANDRGGAIPYEGAPAADLTGFPHFLKIYKLTRLLLLDLSRRSSRDSGESAGAAENFETVGELHDHTFRVRNRDGKKETQSDLNRAKALEEEGRLKDVEAINRQTSSTIAEACNEKSFTSLGVDYKGQGNKAQGDLYARKAEGLRMEHYCPMTMNNYRRMKGILDERDIGLVCVQYPMLSVEPLKRLFASTEGIVFVDNEMSYKRALENGDYGDLFTDNCYGDFGHGTRRGNRILAENVADAILR